MSDTNRVAVGIVEESTRGTTPATPSIQALRVTSAGLAFTPNTVVSDEIRSDRQITDLILVGAESGGDIGAELSFEAADTLFEGAMFNAWTTKPTKINVVLDTEITDVGTVADTYAVDAGGTGFVLGHLARATDFTETANNQTFRVASSTSTTVVGSSLSLTAETVPPAGSALRVVGFEGAADDIDAVANGLQSTSLDFTTLGLVAGEWLLIGGTAAGQKFTNADLNGWARISATVAITATDIEFDILPENWTTEVSSGSKTLQVWVGDFIRNGTTEKFYTVERQFQDHSPVTYEYFRGMSVNTLETSLTSQAIVTQSVSFLGTSSEITETRFTGAVDVAAATNDVMNTSSNVARIVEGGSEVVTPNFVLEASFNINNNLRALNAIGSIGAVDVGAGEFSLTGSLNTYFGNKDLVDKVINNTESGFVSVINKTSQAIVFDAPRIKFSTGTPEVPGKNQDVVVNLEYQAIRHATLGYTFHIGRFYQTVS
jgi:hypothetical protein